ncbi:MAG: 2Fe-2S iron-sulfur cluster-binding protein [Pseudomonadota bacterium]
MAMKLFSTKSRAIHLGPFPMERLFRQETPSLDGCPAFRPLSFDRPDAPESIVNAMREYQAMLDALRDGLVNKVQADCPDDPLERANHLKSFGYFSDASAVGICRLIDDAKLQTPVRNSDIDALAKALRTRQTKTLASGIDLIMANLRDSMNAPPSGISGHEYAIIFLYEYPREPDPSEPGYGWIKDAQAHRAALRANETASVIGNYLRVLGYDAKSHSASASDVDLGRLAVMAGIATVENGTLAHPYIGTGFGLAGVTTTLEMKTDRPLRARKKQLRSATHGLAWQLGKGSEKSAMSRTLFAKRRYVDGAHPFEKLPRVETPTTFIDEPNVARVPKRADMFARAQFGDMGKANQKAATGGHYAIKAAPSAAQRRALGAFVLLQDGEPEGPPQKIDPHVAAEHIKAASYFLGVDAVGISRCPDWTWYSHDARGDVLEPPHDQAISMIIDQGFDTMSGSSGDDWIAVAQSMRAYLRFSLLGGVIAKQIRRLGYSAKAHTVIDGEVLQPPLLLLSGLGEVSRIGEVILNPYLGPRLKSGVVTTDLLLTHDKPIDFGLQSFCESCNKCARECPSGAITAGPKLMFNGYEIWKSDSQKCTSYRITTPGGAMCGRCMKTCPWNLEGLFAEAPFRWAAMKFPKAAPVLAKLDDQLGKGDLNPVKKWWWDLELEEDGGYRPSRHETNKRGLQRDLDLRYEDQTLAVYPAPLAPHPYPYPYPMDREAGIAAYQKMISAAEYRRRLNSGQLDDFEHRYTNDAESPVIPVTVTKAEPMSPLVTKYEFAREDGLPLPPWQAGAHLDIVVAPEFLRQYSMSGDPGDRSKYQIGVLREDKGRGGSRLMHRIFTQGRRVFIAPPINHFPLAENATQHLLLGGGIGVTPMIAMAHELHRNGEKFTLHYSMSDRASAGFLDDLKTVPWSGAVQLHVSSEGSRADLPRIMAASQTGAHVYTCGPEQYMQAVLDAAEAAGVPEEARHMEYFSVPEVPEWENHAFKLKLARSGRSFDIPSDKSATEVLYENGIQVDVKCSDGICGVCKCGLVAGEVEHRDFVLSKAQRETQIILCQSRAASPFGEIEVDL